MKRAPFFLFLSTVIILLFLMNENAFAAGNIKVLGSLTHEKAASSGELYDGVILIKNTGKDPCKVKIYQTDYLYDADGKNVYGTPGSNPCSNARWIALSANWVTIAVNETATVNYSVQVPQNSNSKGTYWSMLMVEPADDPGAQELSGQRGQYVLGLQTVIRYGIQVITNIGDTGTRKIEFLDKKIITDNEKKFLQLDIKNAGERTLYPAVSVQIYNKDGKLLGNFTNEKIRILPSCSIRSKIALPVIPKGKYKALVIVDNGDQYVFGANYDLGID